VDGSRQERNGQTRCENCDLGDGTSFEHQAVHRSSIGSGVVMVGACPQACPGEAPAFLLDLASLVLDREISYPLKGTRATHPGVVLPSWEPGGCPTAVRPTGVRWHQESCGGALSRVGWRPVERPADRPG